VLHGSQYCLARSLPTLAAAALCNCSLSSQVREKFNDFSGQELACIAWALRRFGYTHEHNAVFYMLQRQVRVAAAEGSHTSMAVA
jgi:hypothetical protein